MTSQHALFTPASLGPDLEITQGGEVIQPGADSLSNARTARATQPQTTGAWSVEFLAWGPTDALDAIVGIVTEDADLSDSVGADAYGIGYQLATGEIHNAGAVLATVATAGKGDIVSVQADLPDAQVLFYLNGALLHTEPLPSSMAGAAIYPAASIGSELEADGRVFMNAGQRAFEYPLADSDGWYSIPVTIDTLRFADGASYWTAASDEIPHAHYEGNVAQSPVTFVRALNFWPWGDERSRGSAAQLVINDPEGKYDSLIGANVRDLEVTVHEVPTLDTAFANADLVGSFVLERVDAVNDGQKRLTLRDRSAVLDQPLQTRLFLPNAPEEIANRPLPICIGACRSVSPVYLREDDTGAIYQVADTPCSFGLLREKGDMLLLTTDWTVQIGAQQINLVQLPAGKLTIDVSSVGGSSETTPPSPNLIPDDLAAFDDDAFVTQLAPGDPFLFQGSGAIPGRVWSYLQMDAVVEAGKSYRLSFGLSMAPAVSLDGVPRRFSVGQGLSGDVLLTPLFSATESGIFTETFTAAITGPITFAFRGTPGALGNSANVFEPVCFEILDIDDIQVEAISLLAYAREVLTRRAGLLESQWSSADLEAIDAATGYGVGLHAAEPISVGTALQAALVGYSACHWQDADGVIRFTRLVDPATLTPVGTITRDSVLGDLILTPDFAPGLTAQIAGQRNWTILDDTDFVTDYDDVPISLRKTLGRRFRAIRTTGVLFSSEYAHARGAGGPLETLVDDPDSLQREIDRVAALYSGTVRYWYEIKIPIDALPAYELGQGWVLAYPRYGLDAGKPCMLVGITEDRVNRTATLRLWG